MDLVCIHDEYYDPYHILGVAVDDPDDHITRAYKLKAKKYHPDKAPREKRKDYTRKFKIVKASYDYILAKRTESLQNTRSYKIKTQFIPHADADAERDTERDTERDAERGDSPYDFGYGQQKRLQSVTDYAPADAGVRVVNQFSRKKFTPKQFNRLFNYIKREGDGDGDGDSGDGEGDGEGIVHKTTDGFIGYNTSETNYCALVSSFNGLLITGDDLGETGVGYSTGNFRDYRKSFKHKKNPEKIIKIVDLVEDVEDVEQISLKAKRKSRDQGISVKKSLGEAQDEFYNLSVKQLEEKEQKDKAFILKYAKHYPAETVRRALDGQLDATPNLLKSLKQHHTTKFLK